jgi:hypothetical protein
MVEVPQKEFRRFLLDRGSMILFLVILIIQASRWKHFVAKAHERRERKLGKQRSAPNAEMNGKGVDNESS